MKLFKRFRKDRPVKEQQNQEYSKQEYYREQDYYDGYDNFPEYPEISEENMDDDGHLPEFRRDPSNSYTESPDWTEGEAWEKDWPMDQAHQNEYAPYGNAYDEKDLAGPAYSQDIYEEGFSEEIQRGLASRAQGSDQTADLGHRAKYSSKVDRFLNNGIIIMGILLLAVLLIAFLV